MKRNLLCLLLLALAGAASALDAPAPAPAARTIVLVRHGYYDSDPSADPALGPHLSALGVAQANLVGARLAGLPVRFDSMYTSPLQRARDTAASIGGSFPGREFTVLDDLAECTPPSRQPRSADSDSPESLAACREQLGRLFTAHFQPAAGAERTELYVAHGNVIRYLVVRALGVDETAWLSMSVGHSSITRIRIEADGRIKVIAVGDVGHLPPNLLTGASGDPDRSLGIVPLSPAAR